MSDTIGFSLNSPPKEAVDYLKSKGYAISFDFDELMHDAHHTAFTVAKVMQLDLLTDIHQSLIAAQAAGTPFEQWKKDLIPTLKAKQWWGEQEIYDERTGEYKTIRIDGNRLKTIFQTNINTSYAVGRYQQMQELPEEFAYWRYWSIMDSRTRPTHARKHGTILPKTSPWWKTNYPPNGWNCRCKVQAVTQDMIDAKGWVIAEKEPERLADVDFGYDIGAGAAQIDKVYFNKAQSLVCPEGNARKRTTECGFMNKAQQELRDTFAKLAALSYAQNKAMPTPRNTALPLSQASTETDFMKAFLAQFDSSVFTAITLDQLAIDSALFTTHKGDWKWDKNGRAQWLNYMVLNIKEPDEIWRYVDHGIEYLVVISRFSGNNNLQVIAKFKREIGVNTVFEGVTAFATERKDDYLEAERDIESRELIFRRVN